MKRERARRGKFLFLGWMGLSLMCVTFCLVEAHERPYHLSDYLRTEHHYVIPDLYLVDQYGENQSLHTLLQPNTPVLLQFVFTTCATICPVLSASFTSLQKRLIRTGADHLMVSISIDPEHDTPEKLRKFAQRFEAKLSWRFLTGSSDAIAQLLKAFDAYYPGNNKMYHRPLTYLRGRSGSPWVRLEGLLGAEGLMSEYQRAVGQ